METAFGFPTHKGKPVFNWFQRTSVYEQLDLLNLHSDSPANFSIIGGNVAQWFDQSPRKNHLEQTASASRPAYNNGNITFDGSNDFLQLPQEYELNEFSIYTVLKCNVLNKALFGGNSRNDFFYIQPGMTLDFTITSGGSSSHRAGLGLLRYNLLSIRKGPFNSALQIEVNDRVLMGNAANTLSRLFILGLLGKTQSGNNFGGVIRSFGVSSRYVDDATHARIKQDLYNRYIIPDSTYETVIALGDSITEATGSWITQLGPALSKSYLNLGISGSRLSAQGGAANNMRGRFPSTGLSAPFKDRIIILAGTNDIALGSVPAANFGVELDELLQLIMSKGYTGADVCLCSTPYQRLGANAATLDQYRTEISAKATAYSTVFCDVLQAMRDYPGGGDLIMTDDLHPNATGQTYLKDTILTSLTAAGGW